MIRHLATRAMCSRASVAAPTSRGKNEKIDKGSHHLIMGTSTFVCEVATAARLRGALLSIKRHNEEAATIDAGSK